MSSKKSFVTKHPSKYILITNPMSGHTGEYAVFITLKQAKKVLKDESVVVYIFKIPSLTYCKGSGRLLKYPLGEYYNALEINTLNDDVWCSLNVENLKNKEKDFSQYIKLNTSFDDYYNEWKINIEYHEIEKNIIYGKCVICNDDYNEIDSYECFKCKKVFCNTHNTEQYICDC